MCTLITGPAEDIQKLQELDILNGLPDDESGIATISQASWMNASSYRAPRSVKETQQREPEEARFWMEAIREELDWFLENGKVTILNKWDVHKVPAASIPPYKWNADMMVKLRLMDLAQVERLSKWQDKVRQTGGTVDLCFDILSWTWDFVKNMSPVLDAEGKPTSKQVFKKCRARACIKGNEQVPLHTYDPLRVSAAVVHPAGIQLVNIIIVNFGLLVFKIDDPKAFCQGEADYPIVTYVPRGVEHMEDYAPHEKDTRYLVTSAIYGLIQASLRYFLRAADVLAGIGFIQCDYAKTIFIKHFESQRRFILFWQHVDDRWGGTQQESDLLWFIGALKE
jgi:hypothetical protein